MSSTPHPIKVLIADDHAVVREGLKQMLSAEPDIVVVAEARDGLEALQCARTVEWDVAVLDYSMPGRGGMDLVRDIKRHSPEKAVLVLSMYPEEMHALQVFRAGASGYINKGSADRDIAEAIRKVARGGKYITPLLAEKFADAIVPGGEKPLHESLSERELRVLCALASGKELKKIGEEMFLSASSVSTYRARILRKLQLANNADLVRYAIKNRLVS